jgi:hypothetical protein
MAALTGFATTERADPANLRILIGCELTGTVRRAFAAMGFDAWSCDLKPAEDRSNRHIVGDIRDVLNDGWDMLAVFHPPCTRLCNSGVRWLTEAPPGKTLDQMWRELDEGAALFSACWNAPIPHKAVENPVMHKHAKARIVNFRRHAQSLQPWQFGDWEKKRTCWWLDNLPAVDPEYPTIAAARSALSLPDDAEPIARVHKMGPSVERAAERSRFFPGMARALAKCWGEHVLSPARVALAVNTDQTAFGWDAA